MTHERVTERTSRSIFDDRRALTNAELAHVVGGDSDPNDPVGTGASAGVEPDLKATPILF